MDNPKCRIEIFEHTPGNFLALPEDDLILFKRYVGRKYMVYCFTHAEAVELLTQRVPKIPGTTTRIPKNFLEALRGYLQKARPPSTKEEAIYQERIPGEHGVTVDDLDWDAAVKYCTAEFVLLLNGGIPDYQAYIDITAKSNARSKLMGRPARLCEPFPERFTTVALQIREALPAKELREKEWNISWHATYPGVQIRNMAHTEHDYLPPDNIFNCRYNTPGYEYNDICDLNLPDILNNVFQSKRTGEHRFDVRWINGPFSLEPGYKLTEVSDDVMQVDYGDGVSYTLEGDDLSTIMEKLQAGETINTNSYKVDISKTQDVPFQKIIEDGKLYIGGIYKIHLQPKPEYQLWTLRKVFDIINQPNVKPYVEAFKVILPYTRVYSRMKLPSIVVYPTYGQQSAQKVLNAIAIGLKDHPDIGIDIVPRYNHALNSLIYWANGHGDDKEFLREASLLDEYYDSSVNWAHVLCGDRQEECHIEPQLLHKTPHAPSFGRKASVASRGGTPLKAQMPKDLADQERKNTESYFKHHKINALPQPIQDAIIAYTQDPDYRYQEGYYKKIDNAISQMPPSKEELVVFSGQAGKKPNTKRWFSASTNQTVAIEHFTADCCLIVLYVQPGVKMLPVYQFEQNAYKWESEVLIQGGGYLQFVNQDITGAIPTYTYRYSMEPSRVQKAQFKGAAAKGCTQEECEQEGKLCNPRTGNCVQDTATNRRKLRLPAKKAVAKKAVAKKAVAKKAVAKKAVAKKAVAKKAVASKAEQGDQPQKRADTRGIAKSQFDANKYEDLGWVEGQKPQDYSDDFNAVKSSLEGLIIPTGWSNKIHEGYPGVQYDNKDCIEKQILEEVVYAPETDETKGKSKITRRRYPIVPIGVALHPENHNRDELRWLRDDWESEEYSYRGAGADFFKQYKFSSSDTVQKKELQSQIKNLLSGVYKIHLQPEPEHQIFVLQRLFSIISNSKAVSDHICNIKAIIPYNRVVSDERIPSIVVYPAYGKESASFILSTITKAFKDVVEIGMDITPRFNHRHNQLVYWSSYDGTSKRRFREQYGEDEFKKVFAEPDFSHFICDGNQCHISPQ